MRNTKGATGDERLRTQVSLMTILFPQSHILFFSIMAVFLVGWAERELHFIVLLRTLVIYSQINPCLPVFFVLAQ